MPEPIDTTLPEVVQRYLQAGHHLEHIRLDSHGRWWHNHTPITHPRLCALFSRSISQTPGGTWVLQIPPFTYPIHVDATPLFVTDFLTEHNTLYALLSDATREPLLPHLLRAVDGGGLHLSVKHGTLEARFSFDAYIRFVHHFVHEDTLGQIIVEINSQQHILVGLRT